MNNWKKCKLGDIIDVKHGYAFKGHGITSKDNNKILVTPGNFNIGGGFKMDKCKYFEGNFPESYILKHNDIVLTMTDLSVDSDTLGYSAKIPNIKNKIFLHNQRIGLVIFNDNCVDRDFIYWLTRSPEYHNYIVCSSTGTSIRHTSPRLIKEFVFELPPLEEQRQIAAILSSIDDKIELLHEQNKTLEELAQTLFRHYFIENPNPSWQEKPLSEIAKFLNGLACQKYPPKNFLDKLPVLKIKELSDGAIGKNPDYASSEIADDYIVNSGDVIFSWSATLMVKIWGGEKSVLNQHLFKVSSDKYPKWFFYYWTKYHLREFITISQAHATTMGHIKRKDLDNAMCKIPKDEYLKKCDLEISPKIQKIENNLNQIRTLENMRDILLPKLLNGEIKINN